MFNLETYTPPPLHPNFLAGVRSLPEVYDESSYMGFIKEFGTHFLRSVVMGSRLGRQSEITESQWATLNQ